MVNFRNGQLNTVLIVGVSEHLFIHLKHAFHKQRYIIQCKYQKRNKKLERICVISIEQAACKTEEASTGVMAPTAGGTKGVWDGCIRKLDDSIGWSCIVACSTAATSSKSTSVHRFRIEAMVCREELDLFWHVN